MKLSACKIGEGRLLALELLHVILTECAQAKLVSLADDLGWELLGHGYERNFVALAARPMNGGLDSLLHLLRGALI